MSVVFQKALLMCPDKYSLFNSFSETLKTISAEVIGLDIRSKISSGQLKFDSQVFRFPNKVRGKWETYFLSKINKAILGEFSKHKPDLVFVYNSEYLLPETCKIINKSAKLVFFMGDSPFYTPVNNHYLSLLQYADLILAPDSFWLQQLNMLGLTKTTFFVPAIDNSSYYELGKRSESDTEILYVGSGYVNSWGYKKALLMSQFTKFSFRLYGGSTWKRWFNEFPELKEKFTLAAYIETEKLNKMFNRTKLIPVDGNPGIINGIHIRVLEALGSGALPLIEYRKDVTEIIFKEMARDVPLIQNYKDAASVATHYLKNDNERKQLSTKMKELINSKYSFRNNAELIISKLKEFQK